MIVMLTSLVEGDLIKCTKYWPDVSTKALIFGDMEVTIEEETDLEDFILRKFSLSRCDVAQSNVKIITHIQVVSFKHEITSLSVCKGKRLGRLLSPWQYQDSFAIYYQSFGIIKN